MPHSTNLLDMNATSKQKTSGRTFVLKALTTVAEGQGAYRLRHNIFKALGYITETSTSNLEIDPYDKCSISFGAVDLDSGEVVATLRLITNEPQPDSEEMLHRILWAARDSELSSIVKRSPAAPMPSLFSPVICDLMKTYRTGGREVEELSRSVVKPEFRNCGLFSALMEYGLAYATLKRYPVLVGGCIPAHAAMYAKYGYEELSGAGIIRYPGVGMMASTVICDTARLPEPLSFRVKRIQEAMASTNDSYKSENCVFEVVGQAPGHWRLFAQH